MERGRAEEEIVPPTANPTDAAAELQEVSIILPSRLCTPTQIYSFIEQLIDSFVEELFPEEEGGETAAAVVVVDDARQRAGLTAAAGGGGASEEETGNSSYTKYYEDAVQVLT